MNCARADLLRRAASICVERSTRALDACFAGEVRSWIYLLLRSALALLLLIREADWLRPWVSLDHHSWVRGLDFAWSIRQEPYLVSPLVAGWVIGPGLSYWLVRVRTVLALALLLGVRPRSTALLLSVVSYLLLLADRYRYFHHLHVLYLSIAWLSLVPAASQRGASARAQGLAEGRGFRPAWPLMLLRAGLIAIYWAAGSAKLNSQWWSGATLLELTRLHAITGPTWLLLQRVVSVPLAAKLVCLTELLLPLLLLQRATRRSAVLIGCAFHALLGACMALSTFGAQMALLLLAFWPTVRAALPAQDLAISPARVDAG